MKKYSRLSTISSLIVLAFIIPQIAFAAWWNPISWFGGWSFFHRTDTKTQVLENRMKELEDAATSTPVTATTTKKADSDKKAVVAKPTCTVTVSPTTITQGETAVLSWVTTNVQPNSIAISSHEVASGKFGGGVSGVHKMVDSSDVTPPVSMKYSVNTYAVGEVSPSCSTILTVLPTNSMASDTSATASWSDLEVKYFAEGTQKKWAYLYITNSAGAQRFYRSENGTWVQKNTLTEAQQPYRITPSPQTFSRPYIIQPPSSTITPPPTVITTPKVSTPVPPAPTLAQQKQACQDKYNKDLVSIEANKLSAYSYYTSIINTTPSDEYFAERGLTSSSQRTAADAQRNDAQSAIASATTQYNARLSDLKTQLQSCLDNIVPAQ